MIQGYVGVSSHLDALGAAADSNRFFSMDHLGRLGPKILGPIINSVHIENVLAPTIVALANGDESILQYYEGDPKAAISARGGATFEGGFSIVYKGPIYEVLTRIECGATAKELHCYRGSRRKRKRRTTR